ncbi:hypothetical protein K439DRAFT_1624059 [Ramaria rubella]|nr:hypothetical protein K439DRAFT_1624059 [Ramaria rubella]
MDFHNVGAEVQVDPSHEGSDFFHFIDMAWDSTDPTNPMDKKGPTRDHTIPENTNQFQIPVLGTEGYDAARTLPQDEQHDYVNQTLILYVQPTVAIPLATLALYHRCHLCCPQFSIQQWVKVLCDISNINYSHSLRDKFSDTFDIYLEIVWHVDHAMKVQMGCDSLTWRIRHACPPVNISLKWFLRMDCVTDPLIFDSDYFISQDYVDQFKDEVKHKVRKPDHAEVEIEGDPTNGHSDHATCTDHWQAAMADTLKGMFNAFAETGVFVSVCWHGTIWTILNMMRSGKLAKHAHNRLCQLSFHILMSRGFGLKDLETCKHVFAGSNAVARLTCHSTPFHQHQFIDKYFRQWDTEKYENLGHFLFNNYKQALEILQDMPNKIKSLTSGWEVSEAQFVEWLQQECDYLNSKHSEPEVDVLGVEYVELLDKNLWESSQKLSREAIGTKNKAHLQQVTHDAWEGVLFLQNELQAVEESLDVGARWTSDSPEYQCATEYVCIRSYQHAVDKLEGLVVQRLFELTKANVSQTGYRQCTHISKALKSRSKATQRALASYNMAALTLDPPQPKLTWAQIVEYTTITGFELLCTGAREDIRNLAWADARKQEATICHPKMVWAQEEITCLNIEIKRLATWLMDEDKELKQVVERCAAEDPLITAVLQDYADERRQINTNLQVSLNCVYTLRGYTGDSGTGVHDGGPRVTPDGDVSSNEDDENMLDEVFEGVLRLTNE